MIPSEAAFPRVRRRVELRVPANEIDTVLKALNEFAPKVLERSDETGRLRVDLVGPANRLAEVLDAPESRSAASDPHPVREIVRDRIAARIMHDEVLPARQPANDPVYPDPALLRRIGVPWDPAAAPAKAAVQPARDRVTVAIVDSGIMTGHQDLTDHVRKKDFAVRGRNVIPRGDPDDIEDSVGHGTLLAGVVLAAANRSPAVELMPIKFIDGRTRPNADVAADGITWALCEGAEIINLSFELGLESPKLREAIESAGAAGVLVVVAAGNSGADNDGRPAFPACYGHDGCRALPGGALENVITVMATDPLDDKPGFSNYGDESVHVAAPGVRITSTHQYLDRSNRQTPWRYQRFDGTSAAAACVAGAAAFLKAAWRDVPVEVLKQCLIATGDYRPDLPCISHRRVNVWRALECLHAEKAAREAMARPPARPEA